jgi:formylglycine-generating enzyme required for sulfatase activity
MTLVPGGTFQVVSTGKTVTLESYCLDVFEVTVAAFQPCSANGACKEPGLYTEAGGETWRRFCNVGAQGHEDHPVNCLDFEIADAYCKFVHKRLPTAEEFEWAARNGPAGDDHPWGPDAPNPKVLNACGSECVAFAATLGLSWLTAYPEDDGWATTSPGGAFPAGADRWGVQDLVGNMSEWTSTADGTRRVLMGGNWSTYAHQWLNASARDPQEPTTNNSAYGFRCAL